MNITIEKVLNSIEPKNINGGPVYCHSLEEAQTEFMLRGLELIGKKLGVTSNRYESIGLAIGTTDIEVPDIITIAASAARVWAMTGIADAIQFLAGNGDLTENAIICLQRAFDGTNVVSDSNRNIKITLNIEEL